MNQKKKFNLYVRQRSVAKDLWSKIFQTAERQHLVKAAKLLDIWEEPDQLLVESDFEFDLFTEFYLFNYRIAGKSPVEIYAAAYSSDNEVEQMLLNSGVNSKPSLFLVNKINPGKRTISIIDLLNLEVAYEFMDFTMSQQPHLVDHVLYTRLLPLPQINMLTGATMPFPPEFLQMYPKLYRESGKKLKTQNKEIKQFQVFWHLYQAYGLSMSNLGFS